MKKKKKGNKGRERGMIPGQNQTTDRSVILELLIFTEGFPVHWFSTSELHNAGMQVVHPHLAQSCYV